jgi:adenylate cyclase
VRLTIGKKLNGMLVALQLLSIVSVVIVATTIFKNDLTNLLRKGTLDVSTILAGRVRAEMKHVADRARMLGAASLEDYKYDEDKLRFVQENLAVDPQYVAMALYRRGASAFEPAWRVLSPDAEKRLKLTAADFQSLDEKYPLGFEQVARGSVDFTIARLRDGTPSLRMALPFVQQKDGGFSQLIVMDLQQERLTSLFAEATAYTSYLVDRHGLVLASSDPTRVEPGSSAQGTPIFGAITSAGQSPSGQLDFKDSSGEQQLGAFQRVGFADLAVISEAPFARAAAAQLELYRRVGYLAASAVALALCLGMFFSGRLTRPIQMLGAAADRIANGDFSVRLEVGKSGGDEIQDFSSTFNHMVAGLVERDKVKETFAKFHSKEVAEKVMSGELKLGGERKGAVVFFSDVRGFTAMSEGQDPEKLVRILNRYMTRMVRVIMEHGGIVDKYVGDAIMAVWGVPFSKDDDCERAVRACLSMRLALAEVNAEFAREGLPPLRIGMGLNQGMVISGNIGSEERMEYTVIGDTVNTASRIESITKEFGTDLLISREVLEHVAGKFIVEKADEAKVKGKAEALVVYKVLGYVAECGTEVRIRTPFSDYKAERSDKVVHAA